MHAVGNGVDSKVVEVGIPIAVASSDTSLDGDVVAVAGVAVERAFIVCPTLAGGNNGIDCLEGGGDGGVAHHSNKEHGSVSIRAVVHCPEAHLQVGYVEDIGVDGGQGDDGVEVIVGVPIPI